LHTYLPEWEKDFPWVTKASNENVPFCKGCRKKIAAKKCNLTLHEGPDCHKLAMKAVTTVQPLGFSSIAKITQSEELKSAELELTAAVCCHTSVNHLCELIKKHGKRSCLEDLKLHRTKCSHLIDQVLAPSFLEELVEDIQGFNFSLLAD